MRSLRSRNQKGSVSMFVVIFATLLVTIVTVGFVKIMINDQQQASTNDISQSAYDSAQAGIEDAKRAIANYKGGAITDVSKWSSVCNASVGALSDIAPQLIDSIGREVPVQNGNIRNNLDQSYTCVKINLNTDDYLGSLSADNYKLIPLKSNQQFDTVQIEWFNTNDIGDDTTNVSLFDGSKILPMQSDWKYNTPPVFRAQLIDGSGSFKLSDFDNDSRSSALFLYPSSVGLNSFSFSNSRLSPSEPKLVKCSNDLASGGYSCKAQLSLGRYIPGNSSTFLRLGASYNKSSYRVKLIDSSSNMVVKFDSVQPEIDSTGRANDLFRRVLVRVELTDLNFPYPDMAVDIFGNFCKDFMVTSDVSDYASANVDSCRP